MEGNEMHIFVHTPPEAYERDENSATESLSRNNKSEFRHFVEESTLRNISLDELEELSDAGPSGIDGNIRRTPSSVSSEQPVRFALIMEWDSNYVSRPVGMFRLALLVCCFISLGCVITAGDSKVDVLEMPFSSSVRAHIFVSVFAILTGSTILLLGVTTLLESFPPYWSVCDAALHGSLGSLFIFSSAMLLHAENHFRHTEPQITEWTKVQISLSAVFGFLSAIVCVFLTIFRACASKNPSVPEDIMLTSLRSS